MPPDPFEQELRDLLEQAQADGTPFEELREYVAALFRKHDREMPPPITGALEPIEPEDRFG